ncbi:hypothetical protein JQC67_05095 [Aurantibacter crassamenti]|uniref:hypothetical protein n=1 Tax=Aurantibacter crassamenti TaxID=1837375 RepID=UPI001939A7DE|nr:hypothetical protein [Aurantibacter crassamenti]MBM1105513.1 hypothetical protein [Aurantibacter crassamenti]
MRFLLSSLVLVLVSCGSYPKNQNFMISDTEEVQINNPYFSDSSQDYIYKADIKVLKKSFSGIFIVKKMGDKHHRIVFTTEMGNKLFDFEFLDENFKINHILPEMDKKILINTLKYDFFALIKQNSILKNSYSDGELKIMQTELLNKNHFYLIENSRLTKIVRVSNGKEKVTFLFSGINDNIATDINIQHHNIKLNIHLKKL